MQTLLVSAPLQTIKGFEVGCEYQKKVNLKRRKPKQTKFKIKRNMVIIRNAYTNCTILDL